MKPATEDKRGKRNDWVRTVAARPGVKINPDSPRPAGRRLLYKAHRQTTSCGDCK
jgi:hypothetical protein